MPGIVKYVGKVDSEYVDNRMYVGVKLDDPGELQVTFTYHPLNLCGWRIFTANTDLLLESGAFPLSFSVSLAVGDSDGLFKGKRYFTCSPKHGKMVRISSVIAVLYPKLVISLCNEEWCMMSAV